MNLQEARQKIDELDKVLITTFEQRLKVILEIAKLKNRKILEFTNRNGSKKYWLNLLAMYRPVI